MSVSETTTSSTSLSYDQHQYSSSNNYNTSNPITTTSVWEIEEENSSSEFFEVNHSIGGGNLGSIKEEEEEGLSSSRLFTMDVRSGNNYNYNNNGSSSEEDCVYVGVGKDENSSVDALSWALKNAVKDPTAAMVCLVHVFPKTHYIPSPLGKLPKSQVSPEQVENYMAQERGKRSELLQKFINMCTASQVKVDTVLIESDMVAKAFLDLIPILNMSKLVLGITKSDLRRLRSKRGSGLVGQILQNAPESCEIKIICEGKEVTKEQQMSMGSPSPRRADYYSENAKPPPQLQAHQVQTTAATTNDSFACMCFKSPRVI